MRCFLCHRKMNEQTGLCTNPKCVRSKPLPPKTEKAAEEKGSGNTESEESKS